MSMTQSKAKEMVLEESDDPNENVNHPRWYTAHSSGIECIEITEHLPFNLGNAVKYIWRCGLKKSSGTLRDLRSAEWYVRREISRIERFGLEDASKPKTESVWRALADRIIKSALDQENYNRDLLAQCLDALLRNDLARILTRLDREILNAQ